MAAEEVRPLDGYQAVVVGSAVNIRSSMKPARKLAERSPTTGEGRAVWLFSSGPVGEPPQPAVHPVDMRHVREVTPPGTITCSAASS